jgi:catechol 2,3-dioxygenase-like lactoylglutathione lyase family enzyme
MSRIQKVNTVVVVVPVTDQERALDFYVNTLGLEKRVDIPMGDQYRWVEVAPVGAETTLAVVPPPPGKTAGNQDTGICLYTDDIAAYHSRLKDAGADVDAEISRMGDPVPPMCWFRDPDGNSLLVVGAN